MPGFNQMGPENKGPVTGRGMGRCARKNAPEDQQEFGEGRMRRRGCGRRGQGRFRSGPPGRGRD